MSSSTQFNFNDSEIQGSASAAGISTFSDHHHGDRNLSNAMGVWASQVGSDGFTRVMRESGLTGNGASPSNSASAHVSARAARRRSK